MKIKCIYINVTTTTIASNNRIYNYCDKITTTTTTIRIIRIIRKIIRIIMY